MAGSCWNRRKRSFEPAASSDHMKKEPKIMSLFEEVGLTFLVSLGPILLALLIGAVCWVVSYWRRRKHAMDADWEAIYDDEH